MKDLLGYIKKVLVFLIPFFVIVAVYIVIDPFMVIFRYNDFNKRSYIPKNRDYVSSEVYLMNREEEKYDSFIFGSSTALFVRPSIWMSYLPDTATVFSFDASRENIIGIWSKIKYIDHMDDPIENTVFVIDFNYAFDKLDRENVLFVKHPRIWHSSWFNFQYKNLLKIFDLSLIRSLVVYGLTNEFKPYMSDCLLNEKSYINPVTNEYTNFSIQEELNADSLRYYEIRRDRFPERSGQECEYRQQITSDHIEMLNEIKDIFKKHGTDYRIIIAPNYQQISFNKKDLEILHDVFGKDKIFDFTGINNISKDKSNFYDGLHFKPYVGKQLLDITYGNSSTVMNASKAAELLR